MSVAETDIARTMLPNMPTEVFDEFLKPLIISYGWPFRTVYVPLNGTEWCRIFYPLTLVSLSQLIWIRREFILKKESLCPNSQSDIGYVILNKTEDVWAAIGRDSQPCRNSLLWHEKFISETGRLSAPVTIAFTVDGLRILDGNHRIAALFTLGLIDTFKVDGWIGISPEAIKAMKEA